MASKDIADRLTMNNFSDMNYDPNILLHLQYMVTQEEVLGNPITSTLGRLELDSRSRW